LLFGPFRSLRHAVRLLGIGWTLARHDALFPLDAVRRRAPLLRCARLLRRRRLSAARPGQRLAAAFADIGPAFIKLGQMLATRADLFGDEIAADLALLQDRLPPFPAAAILSHSADCVGKRRMLSAR
jgi:ubiquinone biosynthesis protein